MTYINLTVFLFILVVFGLLGGLARAVLDVEQISKPNGSKRSGTIDNSLLYRSLILGVTAALTVPLFLSIASLGQGGVVEGAYDYLFKPDTSGNQDGNDKSNISHLLILGGFCIVAAISASPLLERLSQQLLNAVKKEVKKEVTGQVSDKIGPNQKLSDAEEKFLEVFVKTRSRKVEAETADKFAAENDIDFDDVSDALASKGFLYNDGNKLRLRGWGGLRILPKVAFAENALRVLKAMNDMPPRPRPTPEELEKSTKLTSDVIKAALEELVEWGLVKPSTSETGGYRVRTWGKEVLLAKAAH